MSFEDVTDVRLVPPHTEADQRVVDSQAVTQRWAARIIPPLIYLAGAFYFSQHYWAHPHRRLFGTPDAILLSWYFEWVEHSITHLHNPFISHAMAVPGGVNIMWNTAVLVLAVVFAPLTATIGATATVGMLEAFSPALSATTAYFVLRRLTGRSAGAALGASLYGFGPFLFAQTVHLHLAFAVFPPLVVLVGHQLFVRQDKSAIRTGLLFGVLVGVQMMASEELVVLTALGALSALIAALVVCPRQVRAKSNHAAVGVGIGTAATLLITAVPLYYQFFGPYALPHGFSGSAAARADLASLVIPNERLYYASQADVLMTHRFGVLENTAYLGWPLIALAFGYAAWLIVRRDRFAVWWLLTTLGVIVLSLGSPMQVDGHRIWYGPWAVVRRLPLLDGALPVRLSLITLLLIAGLVAVMLARLQGRRLAVAALVVTLALIPLRPRGPYLAGVSPKTPVFFTSPAVKAIPEGANVLTLPYASPSNAAPMLWQIQTGIRFNVVGGYSVFNRDGKSMYWPEIPGVARLLTSFAKPRTNLTAGERAAGLASLRSTTIRYIVITEMITRKQHVARAAADLTGCSLRPVEDVVLCQVP